ncbi:MAG: hypothetical protein IKW17_02940 [Paludibacteraceae bacterium]|nr:hypothetical protein [Paludibacteraceae bacterium]
MKNYWVIAILLLAIFAGCNKKEVLDPEEDYILMRAFESARNQSDKGIDIEALANSILLYEKDGAKGKICLCNALIGCKLFFDGDYDKSLVYLKKAEANLQYYDSISSFVYGYIVKNMMTTDTILALNYAKKALEKNLEYNNLHRLPYNYMDLSLLSKGDSARYYLEKSLEYFDDWGDNVVKCKYAWWHRDELHPDTMIAYAKPCYDSIHYAGHARILAEAYLRKGELDSALMYIEAVGKHKFFKTDYSFYNSRRLSQLGRYEEANKSWEETYYLLREECSFMFSQRLGAINGEYDLLNEELENKKEKLEIMRAYNVALLVVIGCLLVAIVFIFRYKKNIGLLEEDIVKRKERFNTLFERYKEGYDLDRDTIFSDASENLSALQDDYPKLTNTDLAIIWLMFMNCDRDNLCKLLNISTRYYYNRRSIMQKELGFKFEDSKESQRQLEQLVKKYILIIKRRRRR